MTQYMDPNPLTHEGETSKESAKDKVMENRAVGRRVAKRGLFDVSLLDHVKGQNKGGFF